MINLKINKINRTEPINLPENLVFGRLFTDHIFQMDYSPENGWHNAEIKKYENVSLNPAAMSLHYGQEIFEGLKAYKQVTGEVALFRPEKNLERLNNSADRLCMPQVDKEFVLNSLVELVRADKEWIPTKPGHSLYIRPVMFSTDPFLGVRPSDTYKLIILLSPVGPYYPEGFKPVPILVTNEYVRATRKGIGACKTAGNYAASLLAQREAKKVGFSQVLWLDGVEQKYLEEVGTMNIFVQFEDEVATPPLSGTILPGVTRMSVLQILKDWGYNVNERMISIDEIMERYEKNEVIELFGTGTAAVISSVGKLKYNEKLLDFNMEEAGELGTKLYNEITSIQFGKIEDRYNWMLKVK